jgi:hypothetical protein
MKCRLILLALVCSLVARIDSATAQGSARSKAHLAAAHEFLKTIQLDKTFAETIETAVDLQIKQNPMIEPYRDVMLEFFEKYMSWDSLKDDMAQIYVEEFTIQEIEKLSAFYRTAVGKKAALRMPKLMSKGGELGMRRVQEHMFELQEMIEEKAMELEE